jgi:hypothetical protein
MKHPLASAAFVLIASSTLAHAQQSPLPGSSAFDAKTTPAYGVLVLRKADLEAELQMMRARFTEAHPDVRLKKIELDVLLREMKRMETAAQESLPKCIR